MGTSVENGSKRHEQRGPSWGSSLPVPSVQEIVRNDAHTVPERYIQNDTDRPLTSQIYHVSSEIPVIDLAVLANGDENEQRKLDSACKEWGFFQITNHGMADEVLNNMKVAVASFFELPLEEKKKYAMPTNDLQGYGQGYVVSDQQKLDWNDLLFLLTSPSQYRNIKYWPTLIPGFKETVEEYSRQIEKVAEQIFANLSWLMRMEREFLKEYHREMKLGIRMNYYPACAKPDLVIGVSPYSDSSSITLLLQDDDITGLQIRHKGGWVPVRPIPNAIVINIGDVMESWSNGRYKSIEHRAVVYEKKPRMSIASFVIPDDEVDMGPFETIINDQHHPRMYKNFKHVDYLRYTLARKMEGKANIELLKLESEK